MDEQRQWPEVMTAPEAAQYPAGKHQKRVGASRGGQGPGCTRRPGVAHSQERTGQIPQGRGRILKGYIRKRGSSYEVIAYLGRDTTTGKKKYKSHAVRGTKKQAEAKLAQLLHELNTGAYVEPSKLTSGEYLDRWMRTFRQRWSASGWGTPASESPSTRIRTFFRPCRSKLHASSRKCCSEAVEMEKNNRPSSRYFVRRLTRDWQERKAGASPICEAPAKTWCATGDSNPRPAD